MTIETKERETNGYLYTKNYEYDDKDFDIKKRAIARLIKFHFRTHYAYWQSQ